MDAATKIAVEMMYHFEILYPYFLRLVGMRDTSLARVGFYKNLLIAVIESPLIDSSAQEILIEDLRRMLVDACEQLMREPTH